MVSSTDITGMLVKWSNGDAAVLEELMPVVENELRRLARQYVRQHRPGDTMQTTALVNEAYIRLVDQTRVKWQNRAHFFAIAATMMKRILCNYARDRKAQKRGGGIINLPLSKFPIFSKEKSTEILNLEEALKNLEKIDARKCQVVEMRYFGGMSNLEIAEVLGISEVTVMRDWQFAKTWLRREVCNGG